MWFQIKTYIQFIFTSKNQHGIHSPFVYQLITKCFYNRSNYSAYATWKSVQRAYLKSKQTIEMNDVGAGSRVFNQPKRRISSIAKNAGTTYKRAKLLYRLVHYFSAENALELGTSIGLGSIAIALTKKTHLTTVEACKNTIEVAQASAESLDLKNIDFVNATFEDYLNSITPKQKFDFIFLDGHHLHDASLAYFEKIMLHVHNDTILIVDDIYWSEGMAVAWEKMKNNDKVKVSIDTYNWGILFFRKEQVKEHFKIRI